MAHEVLERKDISEKPPVFHSLARTQQNMTTVAGSVTPNKYSTFLPRTWAGALGSVRNQRSGNLSKWASKGKYSIIRLNTASPILTSNLWTSSYCLKFPMNLSYLCAFGSPCYLCLKSPFPPAIKLKYCPMSAQLSFCFLLLLAECIALFSHAILLLLL
jgi:hypothetical protein